MRKIVLFLLLALSGCTEMRVKRYRGILDPLVGKGKKVDVSRALGCAPVSCKALTIGEQCEYRTAKGRNYPVPAVHQQEPSMGPDLSPFEYFDVIQAEFDGFGIFKEWTPASF